MTNIAQNCKVDNCDRAQKDGSGLIKGLCIHHYRKLYRHGDPEWQRKTKYKHELYVTYRMMISRCYYEYNTNYNLYGGRGIKVCDKWIADFWNFVDDMGSRPKGCSLDRIDNDGNYEPSNCRWATQREQMSNTRVSSEEVGIVYKPKLRDSSRRWSAFIWHGTTKYIGCYHTKELAIRARNDYIERHAL